MRYLRHITNAPLTLRFALLSFLFSLSVEASVIFLPLYADSLGASKFEVGLVAASYGTAYFASSFIFGRQSDKHGRLIFIRSGLGLSAVAYLLQISALTPMMLLAVRGLVGFCLGITSAALMAYVYNAEGQVGRFSSYGSLGWLFGAVAAAATRNYTALFVISAIASALAFCLSFTLREERTKRLQTAAFPVALIWTNRRIYLPFFLRCLGSSAVWAIFSLFLVSIGASKLWVAILEGINMGGQFIAMRFIERFNTATMFRVGLLTSVITFAMYGIATHYLQLVPAQVVLAISWSCLFVGGLSLLLQRNAEHGTAAGLLYSTIYLSASIGPLIGGVISQLWGFDTLMYVASGLTLIGTMLSLGLSSSASAK